MIGLLVAAAAAASTAQPPNTRLVEYAALTAAETQAIATDLKITAISPAPEKAPVNVALEVAPSADHISLALGNFCSAYKLWNPVSLMLEKVVAEADPDGVAGAAGDQPLLTLKLASARSFRRCVEVAEYNVRCITRVSLSGEAVHRSVDGSERRAPISVQVERDSSIGGFCGGIGKALSVISRQAGQEYLAAALKS